MDREGTHKKKKQKTKDFENLTRVEVEDIQDYVEATILSTPMSCPPHIRMRSVVCSTYN